MYNNNYVKCPICKVVFQQKYIRNHYINCLQQHNKIMEIKKNILRKKKQQEHEYLRKQQKERIRKQQQENKRKPQSNQMTLYNNNLYKLYNTTNINEKYTYYYYKYLYNKNVALVGPASSIIRSNSGKLIDTFDIVVRLNKSLPLPKKIMNDIGSRTDILYNSLNQTDFPGDNIINEEFFVGNRIKFLCTSYPNISPFNSDIRHYLEKSTCTLPFRIVDTDLYYKIKKSIRSRPNTGIMAILDLLNTQLRKLYITGMNFYKTSYYKNYQKTSNQIVPYSNNNIHNQNTQVELLKFLTLTDNRIIIDRVLYKILFNNYINFFKQKKSIDNDNIFKFKSNHPNILLQKFNNAIFIGNKHQQVDIKQHELIICMNPSYINNINDVPVISLINSNYITGVINLNNEHIDSDILEYKCNKKYYKELASCLRSIGIYKFSIELFIYLCIIHYIPQIDTENTLFYENNDEYMLYRFYEQYYR